MRSLLQFLAVWGAVIAFDGGTVIFILWALSMDGDPSDEMAASSLLSSLLWSIFRPLMWPFWARKGKETVYGGRRGVHHGVLKMTSQADRQASNIRRFGTVREAKEYLVGVIANEAENDCAPLTEVERKMLFFTETGWTLPDMKQVSAEFDRGYVQDEYEEKIASIVAKVRARFAGENQQEEMTWNAALQKLSKGDHYLLVLINRANPARRSASSYLKMLLSALVLFVLGWVDFCFRRWLRGHYNNFAYPYLSHGRNAPPGRAGI